MTPTIPTTQTNPRTMQDMLLYELSRIALNYPATVTSPAQLQVLAEMWAEDLDGYSSDVIHAAFVRHRRSSAYFPTVADILKICREEQAEREHLEAQHRAALPSPDWYSPTPEEWAENARQARRLSEAFGIRIGEHAGWAWNKSRRAASSSDR